MCIYTYTCSIHSIVIVIVIVIVVKTVDANINGFQSGQDGVVLMSVVAVIIPVLVLVPVPVPVTVPVTVRVQSSNQFMNRRKWAIEIKMFNATQTRTRT